MTRAGRTRAALLVVGVLLEVFFLRFTWISARADAGQWALTYFGRCPGGPNFVLGRGVSDATPPIDIDRDDRVGLMPGQSLALPLSRGARYAIRGTVPGLAPYLVLLDDTRGPRPAPATTREIPEHDASCATGSLVADLTSGREGWLPWRGAATWREDATRLRALADGCHAGGVVVEARVARDGDAIALSLGDCSWQRAVSPGTTPALGVIAGARTVTVERGGGWSRARRVVQGALLFALLAGTLHALLLLGALGARALIAQVGLAGYSLLTLHPRISSAGLLLPAVALWLLLGGGALIWISWRRTRSPRASRSRRALLTAAHLLVAVALLAAPLGLPALARRAIGGPAIIDAPAINGPARCLLTGYSTAAGIAVVPDGADAYSLLTADCGACGHALARHALPGHIFDDVASVLEGGDATVLFWGGANDDLFWPLLSHGHLASSLGLCAYVLEALLRSLESGSRAHPTVDDIQAALDGASERSATLAAEQQRSIGGAVERVRRGGGRFVYAHDFLAQDLAGGRSPSRRLLAQRRREAVVRAGGEFVDLLDEIGDQAGVTWFDDFVHLSAWGHQQTAPALCRALGRNLR